MTQGRRMLVLSLDGALSEAFVGALAGGPAHRFELDHHDGPLTIEAVEPDVIHGDQLRNLLTRAAGVIIVTQHGDAATMDELRRLVAKLPQDGFLPVGHALHREADRPEYKLSCATCGQKLWVSDSHEGRPGRCPGCKQTFLIPSQTRHLAGALQLPAETPVRILVRGDTETAVALVNDLAARLTAREEASEGRLKNTTMRIVIDPEALR